MEANMRRFLLLSCLSLLLLSLTAVAQNTGRLEITVQKAAAIGSPAGPVMNAKVIVVHWTNDGMHPSLVHDQVATTNQMGMCVVNLPAGTYDIFVASSELAPAAFRKDIKTGETASLTANLRSAQSRYRPVE
jgi:hypothetical protein